MTREVQVGIAYLVILTADSLLITIGEQGGIDIVIAEGVNVVKLAGPSKRLALC